MNPRTRKKLSQIVYNHYWANGQHICLSTWEMMDKDSCSLEVGLWDPERKQLTHNLFEIINYNAFNDIERDYSGNFYETWDGVAASCQPSYINRVYFIPKFTCITKEDILKKARKFIKEELGQILLFNYKFYSGEEDGPKE